MHRLKSVDYVYLYMYMTGKLECVYVRVDRCISYFSSGESEGF